MIISIFYYINQKTLLNFKDENLSTVVYSTLGGKTGKLDEAVNRELNVIRS